MAKGKSKSKSGDEARSTSGKASKGGSSDERPPSGRASKGKTPTVDPNLPRPEGPHVSNRGGLVFVGIILGLIGLAIAVQFLSQ